jgi:epoxyqueuosine reductase
MGADAATGELTGDERAASLSRAVKQEALRLGFDLVGIAPAVTPTGFTDFRDWLQKGYGGEMEYLARREAAYAHPSHVMPTVRSVVMLAANYRNAEPNPPGPLDGRVSRYAWNDGDYHAVLRQRLATLAEFLHAQCPGCRTRSVVDTAPMLERDFARAAGLGWFGKNTMLINKRQGSWLFLAGLLTDVALEPDAPHETSHCGTCTRCLEACPTQAFPEPYVLDARKCIAYLTIELGGPVPNELREGVGEWLFGCDICQDVCPWNNKAPVKDDPPFRPRADLNPAALLPFLEMDDEEFADRFSKTALARPGRNGMARNAATVLGNQRAERAVPALCRSLSDGDPVVRGAAAWALGAIGGAQSTLALKGRHEVEDNPAVRSEIEQALSRQPERHGAYECGTDSLEPRP